VSQRLGPPSAAMHILLALMLAGSTACSTPRPPSDADNLLAGAYRVTITPRSFWHRNQGLSGTVILSDQPSPRGCIFLTGDLRVIAVAHTITGLKFEAHGFPQGLELRDGHLLVLSPQTLMLFDTPTRRCIGRTSLPLRSSGSRCSRRIMRTS
jgi:hypothetical protein